MNANLLNAIRKFAASPAGLFDPRRVDEGLPVFAGKEAAAERQAFIRCLASGFPGELQQCPDQRARSGCKSRAAQKMTAQGVAAPLAQEIVDLVDSLVPASVGGGSHANARPTQPQPQTRPPASSQPEWPPAQTKPAVPLQNAGTPGGSTSSLSGKTLVFGIAGGLGALAGELASDALGLNSSMGASFMLLIGSTALWAALLALGISALLLIAQNRSTKKQPDVARIIKTALIGVIAGAAAGAVAQLIFGFTYNISTAVEIISRVICWGLMGCGVGWGASFYVPNYPAKRAALAGLLGGVIGGAIFRATFDLLPVTAGRIVGVAILGVFIGLTISIVEEILREAWITVVWARNETTNVSLGDKPLVLGSSPDADVYLRRDKFPPVAVIVKIENSRVVVDNKLTGQYMEQADGSEVNLGTMKVIIHVKKSPR